MVEKIFVWDSIKTILQITMLTRYFFEVPQYLCYKDIKNVFWIHFFG